MGSKAREGDGPAKYPRVPIELDPCAVERWMAEHSEWVLYLEEDMTAEELRALYHRFVHSPCPSEAVLSEIAAHPKTPPDVLSQLAERRWRAVHLALTVNPLLPAELLSKLARGARRGVLEHIVWHPNTPTTELERLARRARSQHIRESALAALKRRHGG